VQTVFLVLNRRSEGGIGKLLDGFNRQAAVVFTLNGFVHPGDFWNGDLFPVRIQRHKLRPHMFRAGNQYSIEVMELRACWIAVAEFQRCAAVLATERVRRGVNR
jgi:hypothetical protein